MNTKEKALADNQGPILLPNDASYYTGSNVDRLLSHLHKVKKTGPHRWTACCPSHDDRNPSLGIRDDNGAIGVICRAGCTFFEIAAAVGMNPADFFPPRSSFNGRPVKNPFPATDVLRSIQTEAMIVAVAASDIAKGVQLTEERKSRLMVAVGRIQGAYDDY
jgi:hypothetical protein